MILLSLFQGLYDCKDCPTDCKPGTLPDYAPNVCIQAWDCRDSNITWLYLKDDNGSCTAPTVDKAEMEDPAWWADNISNTGDGIRCLCVDASLSKPTPVKVNLGYKMGEKTLYKNYVLPFTTTDASDVNYNFFQTISSCGWSGWLAFATEGASLFGWIHVTIDESDVELGQGEGSLETLSGQIIWRGKCMPPRCNYPLADVKALATEALAA